MLYHVYRRSISEWIIIWARISAVAVPFEFALSFTEHTESYRYEYIILPEKVYNRNLSNDYPMLSLSYARNNTK